MARPRILFQPPQQQQKTQTQTQLQLQPPRQKVNTALNQMQIDRILNRKRSSEYVDAMKRLDVGGHMHDHHKVSAIIDVIRAEMPEIEIDLGPIGIVSQCFLGVPYEVHTLDVTGEIIEHYESFRRLPGGMEKARKLAMSGFYAFIEVYPHALRAVKEDGSVAVLKE